MSLLTVEIEPLAYAQTHEPWIGDLRPHVYQSRVYGRVRQALANGETLCLFLAAPTGSGKTLACYAYSINSGTPAFGVYPTNELIRDQERALKPWLDSEDAHRLLRIDSRQLDYWQDALHLPQHAQTFERLMRWEPTILTNPDILFYTFFGLYRGPEGLSQRLFALLGQYRVFVFDEFHLYNVKQMADVAFLVGTLHAVHPRYGRVFLFASATPDSPAVEWLGERLRLPVEIIEGEGSGAPCARVVAHPLRLTLLPADLRRWKGADTLLEYAPALESFVAKYPQARLVTILDSVTGAIATARALRERFPSRAVGEVHGFSSDQQREQALRSPFTVGTSTIEVGIDFKDEAEKDVLLFEARTAPQFIQRLGRLARHQKALPIPNLAVALVPEYVYHFLASKLGGDRAISRRALYELVEQGYAKPEDFARYVSIHAPAEFQAARNNVRAAFQPDDWRRIDQELTTALAALTGKTDGQAWALYRRYKDEERILAPLLTFRGSGFEVAILDRRGTDPGFPAKRYNLFFLLRRGVFTELDENDYMRELDALAAHWPEDAARERRYGQRIGLAPEDLLGVYGYFSLSALCEHGRKVWFEVSQDVIEGKKAQVTVISGLEIVTDPPVQLRLLNRHLRKKQIVAWFVDCHPTAIKLGRALPPLFEVHDLQVRGPGGGLSPTTWSIAFSQDAYFIDSLGWWQKRREDRAIIL